MIFDYPKPRPQRRHGPAGYSDVESYRPWLRDEFDFRCVYCLKRETWGQVTCKFELDHFKPQSLNPHLKLDYQNLVYACRRCNAVKRDQTVADPFLLLRATLVTTLPDGSLQSNDGDTQRLIRQLDLKLVRSTPARRSAGHKPSLALANNTNTLPRSTKKKRIQGASAGQAIVTRQECELSHGNTRSPSMAIGSH